MRACALCEAKPDLMVCSRCAINLLVALLETVLTWDNATDANMVLMRTRVVREPFFMFWDRGS